MRIIPCWDHINETRHRRDRVCQMLDNCEWKLGEQRVESPENKCKMGKSGLYEEKSLVAV